MACLDILREPQLPRTRNPETAEPASERMSYSRAHPSPRYIELQDLYRTMHERGEIFLGIPPEQIFPGTSLAPQAPRIKRLIDRTAALTVLDYGCGKGTQYESRTMRDEAGAAWPSVLDYWNIDEVVCYDPCYAPYSALPEGTYDGVICTDVLEHCPEEDIHWIVEEIFSFARRFVFANVACYPARKRLPNGENAHCTVRPAQWWQALVEETAARRAHLTWEVWIESRVDGQFVDQKLGNST
jgi:hypothetical protein